MQLHAVLDRMKINYDFNVAIDKKGGCNFSKPLFRYERIYETMIEAMETVEYEEYKYAVVAAKSGKCCG